MAQYKLGELLTHHRKQAKLTAEQLAQKAGCGLTRSVIANVESGRKSDLTVRQLIAVAYVLGVSPADLVVDFRHPYHWVPIADGEQNEVQVAGWLLGGWLGGSWNVLEINPMINGELAGAGHREVPTEPTLIRHELERRARLLERLESLDVALADNRIAGPVPNPDSDALEDKRTRVQAELYTLDKSLRARGVELENPVLPEVPF